MRHVCAAVLLSLLVVHPSWAFVSCVEPPMRSIDTFLMFTPSAPTASQVVTITADYGVYAERSAAATLQSGTINLTLTGDPLGL